MAFTQIDLNQEIEKRRTKNPKFRKAWDESRDEYRLIGEMVRLRKQSQMTQSKLAELTGNKQQVISRIEKNENSPSLNTFCNLLNALGYELQIVKKHRL